jgi:peroxiredoxin
MKTNLLKLIAGLLLALCAINLFAAPQMQLLLKGSYQKIIQKYKGKPVVVALWSVSCTHCGADLEIFEHVIKKYSKLNLVLISTDSPEQEAIIRRSLSKYNLVDLREKNSRSGKVESWVFADSYTEKLRFDIDAQWYGELPRTYFFNADGKMTAISGVLEEEKVEQWIINN